MGKKYIDSPQDINAYGVKYVSDFLEKAGVEILEKNTDPDQIFQLLAKTYDRAMLIAVRTAIYPDIGTIDNACKKQLIKMSEQRKAIPHFAGLTLIPSKTNDNEVDSSIEGREYKVVFYGISVVRAPESPASNG